MVVYQFDKPTEIIFRYVCENPKANLIMLECLHNDYYNPKKSKADDNPKLYGDYAKSCADYLVDCGLIFSKKEGIYTFFFSVCQRYCIRKVQKKKLDFTIFALLYIFCVLCYVCYNFYSVCSCID